MKNLSKYLILAIFLRILVSAFLFHPDIKTFNFQSSFLKDGVINIYPFLLQNKENFPLKEEFVYFPLTYFVLGGYQAVISPVLGSGLDKWLFDADSISVVNNSNIFLYLIFLKLPLLFTDILIAFLLTRFFTDKKDKEKAFLLWLFNPFTIFLIYAFSNIDLYVVALVLISFLLMEKKKTIWSYVFMGIASCIKIYPLIFLPFIFLKSKEIKDKVLSVVIPLLLIVFSIVPFWSQSFIKSALVSGLTTRIFNPGVGIGFGESIILGVVLLSILFFYTWIFNKKFNLLNYWTIVFLIIFSFSHFHITWLLWIAPFLVILAVKELKMQKPILLLSFLVVLIPLFYEDRNMTISLFRIYSVWYDLLPTPYLILGKFFDPYIFQSILHSLFAGGSLILSYKLLKEENLKT